MKHWSVAFKLIIRSSASSRPALLWWQGVALASLSSSPEAKQLVNPPMMGIFIISDSYQTTLTSKIFGFDELWGWPLGAVLNGPWTPGVQMHIFHSWYIPSNFYYWHFMILLQELELVFRRTHLQTHGLRKDRQTWKSKWLIRWRGRSDLYLNYFKNCFFWLSPWSYYSTP